MLSGPDIAQIEEELRRMDYRREYGRILKNSIFTLVVIAALSILAATTWLPVLRIYGSSMSPTLSQGDIVVTVRGSFYDTGDLVAFYYGNKLLVKRCIAGPGDWVSIDEDGSVSVNGELLEEPYVEAPSLGDCDLEFPYQVPDERWFLLGDRRDTSVDSRSTVIGCISQEQIVGRLIFRIWPLKTVCKLP